eukprot:15349494-Ditylum_brightwellii.AAC.1
MPDDMIDQVHQLACHDLLEIAINNRSGSESIHDPPPKECKDNKEDDDSTYHPEDNDGTNDSDDSLPSIPSIQDTPIHHETNNFDLTNTTNITNIVPDEVPIDESSRDIKNPIVQEGNGSNTTNMIGESMSTSNYAAQTTKTDKEITGDDGIVSTTRVNEVPTADATATVQDESTTGV